MSKSSERQAIRLRGVRQNNLRNFDLDLPLNRLIVITGLSGSGKSSLAFDTLFAEGQRRYIETFSPYARQFLDRMDKPQVDSIEGIPPAIAIEQRNAVRTTRSTVGTMTEICDYMKMLWPQMAQLHCRQCGRPVRKETPLRIWEGLRGEDARQTTEDGRQRTENRGQRTENRGQGTEDRAGANTKDPPPLRFRLRCATARQVGAASQTPNTKETPNSKFQTSEDRGQRTEDSAAAKTKHTPALRFRLRFATARPVGAASQTPSAFAKVTADKHIKETPNSKLQTSGREVLVTFEVPLSAKLPLEESLALVAKQGYQRLLVENQIVRLDEVLRPTFDEPGARERPLTPSFAKATEGRPALSPYEGERENYRQPGVEKVHSASGQVPRSLTVIQDRVSLSETNRARFIEACEQAYHFGKGKLAIHCLKGEEDAPMAQGGGSRFTFHISGTTPFSNRLHCAHCDLDYAEPSQALFSFNHPAGACATCRGFGRIISIDYDLVLPDRSKTLAQGVVKPWLTGTGAESQRDLMRMARHFEIPTDVPFEKLPRKWQDFVIEGEPEYGKDEEHQWPRAWYGVKGYFRWLESRSYKMHVRVMLSRYRAYTPCPDCQGKRFRQEALLYRVGSISLADFLHLPVREALRLTEALAGKAGLGRKEPLGMALNEVQSRLRYLEQVGLGYLTLDRPTRTLSGGETERVNLTTCLGTGLVNTLFVLDEPSVGLHARDTERLVRILRQLRDAGNTVVVVEHEPSIIRAADQVVDLGPGHGASGGQIVFQGSYRELLKAEQSLTGQYLSGRKRIEGRANTKHPPPLRFGAASQTPNTKLQTPDKLQGPSTKTVLGPNAPAEHIRALHGKAVHDATGGGERWPADAFALNDAPAPMLSALSELGSLRLSHASVHNLRDLTVEIPLGRLVCISGVSGSGKTTLMREVLLPALAAGLKAGLPDLKASDRLGSTQNPESDQSGPPESGTGPRSSTVLEGAENLGGVVLVDQSILAKTPRSNPAVYVGAFDHIREFFAQTEEAKQRGLSASSFSFNSAEGQCQRCRGAGFEKIEMQFLSDVFIRCPDCKGRRYRPHVLEVKAAGERGQRTEDRGRSRANTKPPPSLRDGEASQTPASAKLRRGKPNTKETPNSKLQTSDDGGRRALSIADLLDSTVEEAIEFLAGFVESQPARRAMAGLALLQEIGLGYLKLGQPINTLSGGESQRLKLVRHLAEVVEAPEGARKRTSNLEPRTFNPEVRRTGLRRAGPALAKAFHKAAAKARPLTPALSPSEVPRDRDFSPREDGGPRGVESFQGPTGPEHKPLLFLFDEPTTGLHFDDVRVLLKVFQRLVNAGHSVVVIEHNLEVIKSADWIIDLGPDAGDEGGEIVAQGTPEEIAACAASHTGRALRERVNEG